MHYEIWRDDIFGRSEDADPVLAELLNETDKLSENDSLDFIDQALQDVEIHSRYSPTQIGIGLNIIFNSTCSDIPFHFIKGDSKSQNEARKIKSIQNLKFLYSDFFDRYCTRPVVEIGASTDKNPMDFICYMLWDIFVLHPGNSTDEMVKAGVEVMQSGLRSSNDCSLVSSLHGLGHWVLDTNLAAPVIEQWLESPTTSNEVVIEYAKQAKTGYVQ